MIKLKKLYNLSNPTNFKNFSLKILPICLIIFIVSFSFGIYFSFFDSPPDYQQGDAVRIMYVHVPSAWIALSGYLFMGISSLIFIIWRHPLASIIAKAISPVGAIFALNTLITGSIWGKPIWGTWRVWDARLTSMLILFFFFLSHIILSNGFNRPERGERPAAILALIGCINLPIVKFSVDWWNTLHQPASILRSEGVSIDTSMLIPLITMFFAFQFFFIYIVLLRVNMILDFYKINRKY